MFTPGNLEDLFERLLESREAINLVQLSALVGSLDVKCVQGGSLFSGDPSVDRVKTVLVDGVEEVVKESDPVDGLDLDHAEVRIGVVVEVGADRKGNGIVVGLAEEVGFHLEVPGWVVVVLLVHLVEGHENTHLLVIVPDRLHLAGADPEDVEDDAVSAGVDVGGENVDFVGGQGAANFLEEEVAVVCDHGELGISLVGVVDPLESRLKGGVGAAVAAVKVFPDGPDVSAYAQRVPVAEVALGHLLEVFVGQGRVALVKFAPHLFAQIFKFTAEFRIIGLVAFSENGTC